MSPILGRIVSPQNSHVEVLTPQNVAVFGERVFKMQLRLNEVSRIGPNPVPLSEKGGLGHRLTRREDHVKTRGEDGLLLAKQRPRRTQP